MADPTVVGVEVGGKHITAAQVNLEAGALQAQAPVRTPVQANGGKSEIIRSWAHAMAAAAGTNAADGLRFGIAMPGPFDYEKGIALMKFQDKYDALYGLDVKELLAAALQVQPGQIRFMNNAACFLQGEALGGAAKGAARPIGLTLGTSLGSAIYENGLAVDAALWCAPYKEGIAQDYLGAHWIVQRYKDLTGLEVAHVKALVELLPEYQQVQDVFEEFGRQLGEILVPYIQQENADTVVIGGEIGQTLALFLPQLEQTLFEHASPVPIRQAQLGEAAALLGAAALWEDQLA
ncbi:ROK family protein [Pontibacter russatus]|uniref:ROK family protein n=1 Tax=Pontibacter russatus TaxID=2694929 RepID=UPI00137B5C93|nr:ROK family protein [Pontibacter russatus]